MTENKKTPRREKKAAGKRKGHPEKEQGLGRFGRKNQRPVKAEDREKRGRKALHPVKEEASEKRGRKVLRPVKAGDLVERGRKASRPAKTEDREKRRKQARTGAVLCWAVGLAGMGLSFASGEKQSGLVLLLLGAAAGAALLYLPVQQEKEKKEKRVRALQADYAGMVTRLGLYMTAGLSLRSSWERAVRDYREDLAAGGLVMTVYEEMEITRREIMGGVFEDRAYADFGRRCGTPEYLRLGSLLETYVQQGNRELFQALEQEAMSALSGDLMRVKKRGEQAGTLLLIPILMLFALTLVLVAAPALMQMQTTW